MVLQAAGGTMIVPPPARRRLRVQTFAESIAGPTSQGCVSSYTAYIVARCSIAVRVGMISMVARSAHLVMYPLPASLVMWV